MISLVVVVIHEGFDMSFKITRQEVVFKQDVVVIAIVTRQRFLRLECSFTEEKVMSCHYAACRKSMGPDPNNLECVPNKLTAPKLINTD